MTGLDDLLVLIEYGFSHIPFQVPPEIHEAVARLKARQAAGTPFDAPIPPPDPAP